MDLHSHLNNMMMGPSSSRNRIQYEISNYMIGVQSIVNFLQEDFVDLNKLTTDANRSDVEKAIKKYTLYVRQIIEPLLKKSKSNPKSVPDALNKITEMMTKAWLIPIHGYELGNALCNALRENGYLNLLISNFDSNDDADEIMFSSAKLLLQCLTTENRAYVVENGLEKVVKVACAYSHTKTNILSQDHARVGIGIIEQLFKHSEDTVEDVIRHDGLSGIMLQFQSLDQETVQLCFSALANLSLYGGANNQQYMIKLNLLNLLFYPTSFSPDKVTKYYLCLAISLLVTNEEIAADVLKSGLLNSVNTFVKSHNPSEFAKSNLLHRHGQGKDWLQRLVPVLSSVQDEAKNLAAFHFCMEASIKKSQGNTQVFREIGAIGHLKKVASCSNEIAWKFASQALRLIGDVSLELIPRVSLWSVDDVKQWITEIGFFEHGAKFVEIGIDGDLLLQLTDENLKNDICITNGIQRLKFNRELQSLRKKSLLCEYLHDIDPDFIKYTDSMLNAGFDKDSIKHLTQDRLQNECCIMDSTHRLRILESIPVEKTSASTLQDSENHLDVFISYRRSNGSELASLLFFHLESRNFNVFMDVNKLEGGEFDISLIQHIEKARNFVLVLTEDALDRCINDDDWVRREIVVALQQYDQTKCNIIPILNNFKWPDPEKLPEDMRRIVKFNSIVWTHNYEKACIDKLVNFINRHEARKTISPP